MVTDHGITITVTLVIIEVIPIGKLNFTPSLGISFQENIGHAHISESTFPICGYDRLGLVPNA